MVTIASSATNVGPLSIDGTAVTRLPPSVPRFLVCTAPMVWAASTRAGNRSRMTGDRMISVCVTSAPMRRPLIRRIADALRSRPLCEMSTTTFGAWLALANLRSASRSVPPAMTLTAARAAPAARPPAGDPSRRRSRMLSCVWVARLPRRACPPQPEEPNSPTTLQAVPRLLWCSGAQVRVLRFTGARDHGRFMVRQGAAHRANERPENRVSAMATSSARGASVPRSRAARRCVAVVRRSAPTTALLDHQEPLAVG